MPPTTPSTQGATALFPRRNLILFVASLATIGAGYAVLSSANGTAAAGSGAAEAASVLLVVGYCVLLPLSLLA
jgi:hypothetical protein